MHQSLDSATRKRCARASQLMLDLVGPVDLLGARQARFFAGPSASSRLPRAQRFSGSRHRAARRRPPRRGHLPHRAVLLHPMKFPMRVDEIHQDLSRRSTSAWAKNALARFRIPLSRRSSLTSRARPLIRRASAFVTPPRISASMSWRLAQWSGVCGTQPIFGAIDSMAVHSEGTLRDAPRTGGRRVH